MVHGLRQDVRQLLGQLLHRHARLRGELLQQLRSERAIAWFGPVPTHDWIVEPRPFFSKAPITPCSPPCCSRMPLTTDTIPAPTIPPSKPSNMPMATLL